MKIRILHINDVYEFDCLPSLKTAMDSVTLPKSEGITIRLIAGDFLAPSAISSVDSGHAMVDLLNDLIDIATIGNHEADVSLKEFTARLNQSKFKWLNSNVINIPLNEKSRTSDCLFINIFQSPDSMEFSMTLSETPEPSALFRIALIGLLTNDPGLYKANAFWGGTILPVIDTAAEWIKKLENSCDLIIPITHQYLPADRILAKLYGDQFPIIIGGHDHHVVMEETNSPNGCCIVKCGADATHLGVTDIEFLPSSKVSQDLSPVRRSSLGSDTPIVSLDNSHNRVFCNPKNPSLFSFPRIS
jgi:5'-nucleotidase